MHTSNLNSDAIFTHTYHCDATMYAVWSSTNWVSAAEPAWHEKIFSVIGAILFDILFETYVPIVVRESAQRITPPSNTQPRSVVCDVSSDEEERETNKQVNF